MFRNNLNTGYPSRGTKAIFGYSERQLRLVKSRLSFKTDLIMNLMKEQNTRNFCRYSNYFKTSLDVDRDCNERTKKTRNQNHTTATKPVPSHLISFSFSG